MLRNWETSGPGFTKNGKRLASVGMNTARGETDEFPEEYAVLQTFDDPLSRPLLTSMTVARCLLTILCRWGWNHSVKGARMVIKATGLTSEQVVFPPRKG